MDRAGLFRVTAGDDYQAWLGYFYLGILNGDNKGRARVFFTGKMNEHPSWQLYAQHAHYWFTPNFEDVHAKVALLVREYMSAWPDTKMAKFARLNAGRPPEFIPANIFAPGRFPSPFVGGFPQAVFQLSLPLDLSLAYQQGEVPTGPAPKPQPTPEAPERPVSAPSLLEAELELTPLFNEQETPSFARQTTIDYVEKEFSNNATTLVFVDERGAKSVYFETMTFRRAIGTLPARHLFVLKWYRMLDYAGLLYPMLKNSQNARYDEYMAQAFAGVLHGDGRASVSFECTRRGGSRFEEARKDRMAACLEWFTPHFDDVFAETVDSINNYINAWPDCAMSDYARRHLGQQSTGWATSR